MSKKLTLLFLILFAPAVLAQGVKAPQRAGTWEATVAAQYQGSEGIGDAQGPGIDFRSSTGLGLGLSWNYTNHFAISADLLFNKPGYEARYLVDPQPAGDENIESISHKANFFTPQLRATWYFLEGPITPFVEGAVGYTYIDSNVADGPPVTSCWWDPWLWRYVCSSFYNTYSDWNLSYAAGAGLRWDVSDVIALRAAYTMRAVDLKGPDPSFDVYQFELLWRF
ncbi:outer membrane protein [Pseudomonadota bacterium]|jgi:opacity protein-like surface antigen|nr:outer membrane beta-barrel protein [Xanthomonadales bacterium]